MTNEELVLEYQSGNQEALDELVQQNTGLVFYFANKYKGLCSKTTFQYDDLVQEGWIGFMNAANKYTKIECQEDENTPAFSTYAGVAIKNRMLRAINSSIPKLKKSDYTTEIKVNCIDAFLPGSDEITYLEVIPDECAASGFEEVIDKLYKEQLRNDIMQMLDEVFGGEFIFNGYTFQGDLNVKSLLHKIQNGITPKEIILLHYGLKSKPMLMKEIGEKVGVSASWIEQLEFKGINAIRKSIPGQSFLKKYEEEYFYHLKEKRESVNLFSEPGKVISQIEMFDEMICKYIS